MKSDSGDKATQPNAEPVSIFFTSEFRRNVQRLSRKYSHIRSDVQPIIEQLLAGQTPGEQIPHVGYPVYKVRISSRDMRRGKQGGYRMIYYVKTPLMIILVTIYSKTEQGDVAPEFIREVVQQYEASQERN